MSRKKTEPHTAQDDVVQPPQIVGPTVAQFAGLAAQCLPSAGSIEKALETAVEIWDACVDFQSERQLGTGLRNDLEALEKEQWPKTHTDFYRLIVRGKDLATCEDRVKQWLSDFGCSFENWKQSGFSGSLAWMQESESYLNWWQARKSDARSAAGRKGGKSTANSARRRNRGEIRRART